MVKVVMTTLAGLCLYLHCIDYRLLLSVTNIHCWMLKRKGTEFLLIVLLGKEKKLAYAGFESTPAVWLNLGVLEPNHQTYSNVWLLHLCCFITTHLLITQKVEWNRKFDRARVLVIFFVLSPGFLIISIAYSWPELNFLLPYTLLPPLCFFFLFRM